MGKAKEALPGLSAHGRSKAYHRRGAWAVKKKNGGKFPVHKPAEKKAAAAEKVRGGRAWNRREKIKALCRLHFEERDVFLLSLEGA